MPTRRKTFTRRAVIGAGIAAAGRAALVGGTYVALEQATEPISTVGDIAFDTPLMIPPLIDPEPDHEGRKTYNLELQTGETEILAGRATSTWGVNGPLLGPTLRARRGDRVAIAVHNELPENTTLHWHGMHLPAKHDGGPHQMIHAGGSWYPEWDIDQPASTLWYHPHPHGTTAEHVYRGVAGLFLIDDDESDAADLPAEYGVDDIPLIIQDRALHDDGTLSFDTGGFLDQFGGSQSFGIFGDTILANGTAGTFLKVNRRLIRFRLLNGSNTRFYNLGFSDDRLFRLVATDNGLVPGKPIELSRIQLGPSERAEIAVAFDDSETVVMRSYEQDLGAGESQMRANDTFDIVELRAFGDLVDSADLPTILTVSNEAPSVPDGATERRFRLQDHSRINDRKMDMARIDDVVSAGALEIWTVSSSGNPHTFHIHGATFHLLDVDGDSPPAELRGPKDTVFVNQDHAVTLAVQFQEHTDAEMPYMYHCHLLRHEDNGMMGQFVVVEPGTEGNVSRTIKRHNEH